MNMQIVISSATSEEETKNSGKDIVFQDIENNTTSLIFEVRSEKDRDDIINSVREIVKKYRV